MSRDKQTEAEQRQFWQMAVETWQSSGLPVRRFCRQEGLTEPLFYSWRKRLAKVENVQTKTQTVFQSQPFIEVSIPAQKASGLELILSSGNTLRINPGTDIKILTAVLSALSEAGLC